MAVNRFVLNGMSFHGHGAVAADACAPGNPRPASLADFESMFHQLM